MMRTVYRRREHCVVVMSIVLLAGAGCGPKVSVNATPGTATEVAAGEQVCVATATDGRYETRAQPGSGRAVTSRTAEALRRRHADVLVVGTGDLDHVFEECRTRNGRFVVVPEIRAWEDRASGWSGQPDRVEVALTLHDLPSGTVVRSVSVTAETNYWASAFTEWGNRSPEALLNAEFDRAVASLLSP